jgi:hypothetical protein
LREKAALQAVKEAKEKADQVAKREQELLAEREKQKIVAELER